MHSLLVRSQLHPSSFNVPLGHALLLGANLLRLTRKNNRGSYLAGRLGRLPAYVLTLKGNTSVKKKRIH